MLTELLVHNCIYVICDIFVLCVGFFVLFRGPKQPANVFYFLISFFYSIFIVGYLLSSNAADSVVSQHYLMLTMVNLFTVCFTAHLSFIICNKTKQQQLGLKIIYSVAILLSVFFLTDINRYVLPSRSILYFPNFYNAGPYYWMFFAFFMSVLAYMAVVLIFTYRGADHIVKKRIIYFGIGFGWAYAVGSITFLPTYGIPADPIYAALSYLFTIPIAYGVLKYDLMDVHVAAKNALLYAVGTTFFGVLIIGVNILNNFLIQSLNVPFWLIPFLSGIIVVIIGLYVWDQLHEVDILKYEFINNITHKFRTPLTHIRWLSEELRDENDTVTRNKAVQQIQFESMRLFELTNMVIDMAQDKSDAYLYSFKPTKLQDIMMDLYTSHDDQIAHKKLKVTVNLDTDVPDVEADKTRMQFMMQILFENALIYTPEGGNVTVTMKKINNEVITAISDSGIGIQAEDIPHLFNKFYRTQNARHTDTEGMGIGLYMAKAIVEKHHGHIWAESPGEGRGATFSFTLPIKHQ